MLVPLHATFVTSTGHYTKKRQWRTYVRSMSAPLRWHCTIAKKSWKRRRIDKLIKKAHLFKSNVGTWTTTVTLIRHGANV